MREEVGLIFSRVAGGDEFHVRLVVLLSLERRVMPARYSITPTNLFLVCIYPLTKRSELYP